MPTWRFDGEYNLGQYYGDYIVGFYGDPILGRGIIELRGRVGRLHLGGQGLDYRGLNNHQYHVEVHLRYHIL